MSLTKEDLNGQFVLAQDGGFIPESWNKQQHSVWILGAHPSLPVTDILTEYGTKIGWLLGYPITQDGELYPQQPVFPIYEDQYPDEVQIESKLYKMGGRFIAVFLSDNFCRLYLDPSGSLSAVYSTKVPLIASTPTLIDHESHVWNEELIKTLQMPDSGLWYPCGLTPRKYVYRLLPNHYLDFDNWKPVRHWPSPSGLTADTSPNQSVSQIIQIVSNHISAVAGRHQLHLGITGGRDTRTLLACARKNLDKIVFFTFASNKKTVDSYIAGKIASKLNLNHRFLQIEHANQSQIDDWFYRTGYCVSGNISRIHTTERHLDKDRAILPGMSGEVHKQKNYKKEDSEKSRLDAEELLNRNKMPLHGEILARTENWLSEIDQFNTFLKLDLWWIEQRLGCWGGPQAYGADNYTVCHLLPFSHRKVFELMLTLPFEYRKNKQLTYDICKIQWPELLKIPINEFSKLTRYQRKLTWHFKRTLNFAKPGLVNVSILKWNRY